MIDQAITFLTDQLDQHLQSAFVFSGPAVTLSTPGKSPAGTAPPEGLVLSLLQVSRDPMAPHGGTQPEVQGTQVIQRKPPLSLTLHLLLCANYDERYDQGLSVLTSAISYFHSHALFAEDTAPTLPAGMGKLSIELASVSLQDLTGLWSVMGGRLQPSVVYQVRLVAIETAQVLRVDEQVQSIEVDVQRSDR